MLLSGMFCHRHRLIEEVWPMVMPDGVLTDGSVIGLACGQRGRAHVNVETHWFYMSWEGKVHL